MLKRFGKREKFLALSFLLSLIFFINYFIPRGFWPVSTVLAFLLQIAGLYSLFKLERNSRDLVSLIPPLLFCLSIGFVQYLFPCIPIWFKAVFLLGSFFCFYLILLVLNIFLVVRRKGEILLLRPAKTALFLLTVLIFFLGSSVLLKGITFFSLQLVFLVLLSFALGSSLLFFFQVGERISTPVILASFLISFLVAQNFISLSFFPQKSFFRALSLTAAFYAFLGAGEVYLSHRLERKIASDFFFIFAFGLVLFFVFPQ